MGNPAAIDNEPSTFHANSVSGIMTIGLNTQREYTIAHNTVNENEQSDTNAVYFATSGLPVTNSISNISKFVLYSGRSITIGPQVNMITFRSAAGAPTFTIVAGKNLLGRF